jgi:hypothetical protein
MILAFLFSFIFLFTSPILAKEYSLDKVNIKAFVNKDSSMSITEERSFNFQGDYRFVYQTIDKTSKRGEQYDLSNFTLCEKDTKVC